METAEAAAGYGSLSGSRSTVNASLLVALAALSLFPLLLLLRVHDDNALVSWRWVVAGRSMGVIYVLHACGLAAAWLLSRRSLPQGHLQVVVISLVPAISSLLLWSTPETTIDASRYFAGAKHLELYGFGSFVREWGAGIDAWTDLPLPAMIYGSLFKLFGESRFVSQALNTLLLCSTAGLTFMTARLLWGSEAGFLAGLLFAGTPYLFTQVPLMLGDVMAMFFLTLSAYLTLSYSWSGSRRHLVAVVLAYGGALLCKYSLWPALFMLAAGMPVVKFLSCRRWKVLLRGGLLFLAASVMVAALLLWRRDLVLSQLELLAGFQLAGLSRWGESYFSTFVFQIHPFILPLVFLGAWHALRKRDPTFLAMVFLPALAVFAGVRRVRYFMVLLPLLSVAAAYGLSALGDRRLRSFAAWHVVVFAAVTAIFLYRPFLEGMSLANLQSAARVLNDTAQEKVDVYLSGAVKSEVNPAMAVPLLDIYTKSDLRFMNGAIPTPAGGNVESSSFRFSWRYRSPVYYRGDNSGEGLAATVFIGGTREEKIPPSLEEKTRGYERRAFLADDGLFNYGTYVTVFLPPAAGLR